MATEVQTLFVSTTQPAVLAFSTVTDGKSKFSDEEQYTAMVEFTPDHPDLKMLKAKAAEVARLNYPGIDLKDMDFPFKRSKNDPNKAVLTARSDYAPNLSVLDQGKLREINTPVEMKQYRKFFYGGAEVLIGVTFRPYEVKGQKGVSAKIGMVLGITPSQSGGGRAAAEVFKGYVGTVSSDDPTGGAGLDDEIPF